MMTKQMTLNEFIAAVAGCHLDLPIVVEGHCCSQEATSVEFVVGRRDWSDKPAEMYLLIHSEDLS